MDPTEDAPPAAAPDIDPTTDAGPTPDSAPPGLLQQLRAVVASIRGLVSAHVELARAEIGEIAAEVGRLVAAGCAALALLVMALVLLLVGGLLFLGEWLFGSIGWGVLHGVLLLLDIGFLGLLIGLRLEGRRIGLGLLGGLVIGIAAGALAWFVVEPRLAIALGLTGALVAWPLLAAWDLNRSGIDTEAIKARFIPQTTIDTFKETAEWVRARTPLGPRS